MNAHDTMQLLVANLPMILSVLAALGLWKLGAALIRAGIAKATAAAAATPNKLDDIVVGVVGAELEQLAKLLEAGNLEGAKAHLGVVRSSAVQMLPRIKADPR